MLCNYFHLASYNAPLNWAECHCNVTVLLPLSVLTNLLQFIYPSDSPTKPAGTGSLCWKRCFSFHFVGRKVAGHTKGFIQNSGGCEHSDPPTPQTGHDN